MGNVRRCCEKARMWELEAVSRALSGSVCLPADKKGNYFWQHSAELEYEFQKTVEGSSFAEQI